MYITITLANPNRPKEVLVARAVPGNKKRYRVIARARNETEGTEIADALNAKEST